MTGGERRRGSIGALVDASLAAWVARWPLYLGLAALSLLIQLGLAKLLRFDPLALQLALTVIDGYPTALASIAAATGPEDEVNLAGLLRAGARRWPVVAIVGLLLIVPEALVQSAVFGNVEETLYGLAILPGIFGLGALALPSVIASIDRSVPFLALPGFALLRTAVLAWSWPNLIRLVAGGAIVAVPLMLQQLLAHALAARGLSGSAAWFWANAPVDALTLAPLQLFFTYLYLDAVAAKEPAL